MKQSNLDMFFNFTNYIFWYYIKAIIEQYLTNNTLIKKWNQYKLQKSKTDQTSDSVSHTATYFIGYFLHVN